MPVVLHLRTVTGRGGGPEKTLLASPRFIGEGYDLRLAYIRPERDELYDMPLRAAQAGATLIDVPERSGFDLRTWKRLSQEICSSRPAILHAHDYKTNVLAVLLGRRFRLPVVTTLHGYGLGGGRLSVYFRIERWALRRMDRIVAVSEDLREYAIGVGVPDSRCTVVHNAVDTECYRRTMDVVTARDRLGIRRERFVIGAVGRLHPEKGFDRLIRAVDQLRRNGAEIELLLVGEGNERNRLEKLVKELGSSDVVRMLGHRSDTIDLYQAMDMFALSSMREAFPNVVLEAMAMEVPVVATRIAGVPRVVLHGVNGLMVEPGEVEGLSRALETLRADAALRARIAQQGRATVEKNFSFAVRMQKIRAIYDELLGPTGAHGNPPVPNFPTRR